MTRTEVERLIEKKLAPAIALVDRVDGLMTKVHALLARTEEALGASVAGAKEQFDQLRSLIATLEAQVKEKTRLLAELQEKTAALHAALDRRFS
ncbi:MAG: hypothetical protein WCB10_17800 [Steroidobacteraceae bacterium]|jgi:hypothetical protein